MPEIPRRGRLLWTLLGAMIVVGLLPLGISHYVISAYLTPDSEILGLRILDRGGKGAEAVPPKLDSGVVQELDLALVAAAQGQPYTGTFQYLTALHQPVVVVAVPLSDAT